MKINMLHPLICTNCGAPTPSNPCSRCLTVLQMANELAKKNGVVPKFIIVGIFDYYHQQLREIKKIEKEVSLTNNIKIQ